MDEASNRRETKPFPIDGALKTPSFFHFHTSAMETINGNWADLPPDLLHSIVEKLSDICDYVRSRAVCKSWRRSISVSELPPQFPWILKFVGNKGLMKFYSIASKKVYTVRASAPNSSNKDSFGLTSMLVRQFGSDDQFSLVRYKQSCQFQFLEGYCSFLNPLNNSEVYLPVVHDPEPSGFRFCWSGPRSFHSEHCVIFSYGTNRSAVCKSDGDKWDCIGGDLGYMYAYLNGLLFTVEHCKLSRVTKVIDIGTGQEVYVIPPPESKIGHDSFLVESSGEILQVCSSYCYGRRKDHKFYIHRLEFGNGNKQPCWVNVTNIGDQMLFFDFVAGRAFSLKASAFPGFNGNCIYFIKTVRREFMIYRYDIENGKTIFIDCPFDGWDSGEGLTWFVPTLKPCI